tara:strand:+ start:988 stop:1173 length:186 start_codon:yes stop_codon:yes gene_type:complete
MSDDTAKFSVRDVWGNEMLYPENELAQFLCDLGGTKTITKTIREVAEEFGIQFEQVLRDYE